MPTYDALFAADVRGYRREEFKAEDDADAIKKAREIYNECRASAFEADYDSYPFNGSLVELTRIEDEGVSPDDDNPADTFDVDIDEVSDLIRPDEMSHATAGPVERQLVQALQFALPFVVSESEQRAEAGDEEYRKEAESVIETIHNALRAAGHDPVRPVSPPAEPTLYAMLYDSGPAESASEEYYAWFPTVEEAERHFNDVFGDDQNTKPVAVVQLVKSMDDGVDRPYREVHSEVAYEDLNHAAIEAAYEDDFDSAVRLVQLYLGVTSGDFAGAHFSGTTVASEWAAWGHPKRIDALMKYGKAEKAQGESSGDEDGDPDRFVNYYEHCGQKWHDTWSCACNDECPVCGVEVEPYDSEDL